MQVGTRVKVITPKDRHQDSLAKLFEDQIGTVSEVEMDGRTKMFRVRLDSPVEVPGVGSVTSDLWSREHMKTTKR